MTLRKHTFSAVRWTTLDSAARILVSVASIAVLARILAPEDYGLMAMVSVVLGFGQMFSDLGVNSAYVQRQDVTQEQRSSLFWLNVLVSFGAAYLVVALSPLLAWFFGDVRLAPMVMLSSVSFVLAALGQQVKMSAEKDLRFKMVVILDIFALALGFITAVLTALAGWGVYSLVVSGVVGVATTTILYWMFVSAGWRPLWRFRVRDIRPFVGFGAAMVSGSLVNYFGRTMDLFLGGRLLGVVDLGFYSVPRNLVLQLSGMINGIVTRVGFPLIAKVQNDKELVKTIYLKTLNATSSVNAPLYVGMGFFAYEIVAIVLGQGWERSGELLRILALWGGLRSTANPAGSLTRGTGRPELELIWSTVIFVLCAPVFWFGFQYGPEGIAWTLFLLQVVLFIPKWYFQIRPLCGAKLLEYSVGALKPFALAFLAIAPAFWIANHFDGAHIRVVSGVMMSAPLYFLLSYIGNRDWLRALLELGGIPGAARESSNS